MSQYTCRTRSNVLRALAFVLATTAPLAAYAEHEANHRYNVRGYVLDANRKPLVNESVSLRLEDTLVGSDRTDSDGHFSIRAHLHDTDIGKTLTLRAGKNRTEIRMQGTARDLTTERVHHVNFVGGKTVERELGGRGPPAWAYAAIGLLIASAGVVAAGKWRRHLKRQRRRQEAAARPKHKAKPKRKRRKR